MSSAKISSLRLRRVFFPLGWIAGMTLAILGLGGCQREEEKLKRHADEANAAFLAGDYNRAEIACKHLLRANGQDTLTLARLGRIWLERGSPFQAAHYLLQATKDGTAALDARIDLAKARIALGDQPGAWTDLLAIVDKEPGRADALLQLAFAAGSDAEASEAEKRISAAGGGDTPDLMLASAIVSLRKGDLSKAGNLIEKALAVDPNSPEAHSLQAKLRLTTKDAAGAEASLAEAARLAPSRSQKKIDYASYLLSVGRREVAVSVLEAAVADSPDFLSAWRLLARDALRQKDRDGAGRFLDQVFAKDALDHDAVLLEADRLLDQGGGKSLAKAITLLERLRERHPRSPLIEVQIARIHLSANQLEPAASAVDRALDHAPEYRDAVLLKADLDLREGDAAAAARSIEEWIGKHPNDREAGRRLAESYRTLGRAEDALRIAESLASDPSANAGDHLRLGVLLLDQRQAERARAELLKAESSDPDDLRASMELVRCDLRFGRLQPALERAQEMTKRQPQSAPARHLAALVLGGLERWDDAEREAREALRLDPGLTASRELLVRIYHASQRPEDALRELEEIRKADPENVQAPMALAMIKESAGDRDAACAIYREIVGRNPNSTAALNNLAEILAEGGGEELVEARSFAEQARNLAPNESAVADTLGWILYRQQAYKRAFGLLREAVADPEAHPTTKYRFAMACRAMGDAAAARKWLGEALRDTTGFAERDRAERALAGLDQLAADAKTSEGDLEKMITADQTDMVARLRLAERYETLDRPQDAAEAYRIALAANPDLNVAASRLAELFAGPLNNPDQAVRHAIKAREIDPDDQAAALILAGNAFRTGEYQRAAVLYQECPRELVKRPALRLDAALAFFSVARIEDAKAVLAPLALDPKAGDEARRLLALLAPDCPESEAAAALARDPRHGPALAASAAAAERAGQVEVAVARYAELMEIYPDFTPGREALARLRPTTAPAR